MPPINVVTSEDMLYWTFVDDFSSLQNLQGQQMVSIGGRICKILETFSMKVVTLMALMDFIWLKCTCVYNQSNITLFTAFLFHYILINDCMKTCPRCVLEIEKHRHWRICESNNVVGKS